eukprot:TRINITY_DN2231_c0_g1_i9.p1 TRINITY_DN2231_c0_g1~~TRINITY_DN2231_c0_g1_i9.p1  ORF type:complete len:233 (-),score=39.86 TRINITY_DN2231_c0_g1_i9:120-818(-)
MSELGAVSSRARPQIIYGLVLRGPKVVLADFTPLAGNFQQATIQILDKLDTATEGKSYAYGEYAFHYIIDEPSGLWFVCMAERAMGRRIPFGYLGAVKEQFKQQYSNDQVECAIAYGMQGEFREHLKMLMETYNSPDADRVASLMSKVQHVNDVLMESIDAILERQEKIDLLVNRSQQLVDSSSTFRRNAEGLRRSYWWKNARTKIIVVVFLILAVCVIILASCGITLKHCQ